MKNNSCMIKGGTNMNRQDFYDGKLFDAYRYMGAHKDGDKIRFVTYAPRASRISIIGEFNNWNEEFMEQDAQSGFFLFYSDKAKEGQMYKYCIYGPDGNRQEHCDPYGFEMELRPGACSIIRDITTYRFNDRSWMQMRSVGMEDAINIYEMHMGSWRMNKKDENGWYQYDEIAKMLVPYLKQNNYTHVELMPLSEHPFDGSWGYQCTGYFSSTSRYGTNHELMHFVNALHEAGIGVIMDFVPVHFVKDNYALGMFDGTPLYEYSKPEDANSEWGTANFDLWKEEVRSFLMSAANFWVDVYHVDGLRMDAISNAIFWHGNKNNGVNEGACDFMKRMNHLLNEAHQGKIMLIAEDSSDFPNVTKPSYAGGLGFDYKWDLGWMNDTLSYLKRDPIYRKWHHHDITFSMAYFYSERFILPFSHDEVVHGKATIVDKMWGSYEDKFAQARALYVYMFAHPGKKLNFMGNEIGQLREWDEQKSCDWFLLDYPMHDAFKHLCEDLGKIYTENDAFYDQDYDPCRFSWIDADNVGQNTFSFIRRGSKKDFVIIMNFSTNPYDHQQFGVPCKGKYKEILNTEWDEYNGNLKNHTPQEVQAMRLPRHNQPYMIEVNVPSFGAMIYEVEK